MIPTPVRPLPSVLRTVFLDRDGVLNQKAPEGAYVARWAEFRMLPGVPEAIARLKRAGTRVLVVSNQRGIARGLYTAADVDALHARLQQELKAQGAQIDAFFVCPHEMGECNCRKPLPGLFEQAVVRFPEITAETSVMVGDSAGDMEFGRRLGMATILIEGAPGAGGAAVPGAAGPGGDRAGAGSPGASTVEIATTLRATSLLAAVEMLLAGR